MYSVAAQETAKNHAKFGCPLVRDVAAVTKARREAKRVEICWGAQTPEPISAASRPEITVLRGHVEEILLFNKFFSDCRYLPY